jgi:hypothetical protein
VGNGLFPREKSFEKSFSIEIPRKIPRKINARENVLRQFSFWRNWKMI